MRPREHDLEVTLRQPDVEARLLLKCPELIVRGCGQAAQRMYSSSIIASHGMQLQG